MIQLTEKATLAYASVFGLVEDTNLVGHQYSWLGAVVYLAQLVAQPAIAFVLVKFPLGKFLAVTTLCWGICLSCMTAAHDFKGLLVSRLFLGLFEAGVAPAFIALTQMWFRRREQPVRLGAWVCTTCSFSRYVLMTAVCDERCDKHGGQLADLGYWPHPILCLERIPNHILVLWRKWPLVG